MTIRNRGTSLCAALLLGAAAGMTVAPAKAAQVIERSIPPAGEQAAPQVSPQASPQSSDGGQQAAAPASPGARPRSLEERVARMEHMLEGGTLVDMLSRLDTLQQQLQKIQGDLEVQQHDLQALRQHERDLYLDLDRRLRKLEADQSAGTPSQAQGGGQTAPAGAGPGVAGAATAQAPSPGAASGQPGAAGAEQPGAAAPLSPGDQQQMQADYDQAFKLLRGAQYDKAIAAFEQFLKKYPDGPLSDNAQYWLGEANYVIRRFPEALKDFQQVVSRYPDSPKVPDAELKAGFTHYELDQWDEARKALTEVTNKYPDTTAAKLAQNRLQRMKKEGH